MDERPVCCVRQWININMRCIEMSYLNTYSQTYHQININMRCIEMAKNALGDVSELLININMRCIEI